MFNFVKCEVKIKKLNINSTKTRDLIWFLWFLTVFPMCSCNDRSRRCSVNEDGKATAQQRKRKTHCSLQTHTTHTTKPHSLERQTTTTTGFSQTHKIVRTRCSNGAFDLTRWMFQPVLIADSKLNIPGGCRQARGGTGCGM